jgi:phosphoserine phosphatase
MEDRTVIISSRELVDHTVLSRRKNELAFKRDFLLRTGAKQGDLHLKAIEDELFVVEEKLRPVAEKLEIADMVTFVPHRKEIGEYTGRINQFSREQLDEAVRKKAGEAYELMRKRAALVKHNFERREDIARMTVLLNGMPRKEGEAIRDLLESGEGADADVSFLPKEGQQELVNLASRIGRQCCVISGTLSLDKKKAESAELKPADELIKSIGNRQVWVEAGKMAAFEENEKRLSELLAKMNAKNAEKQARALSEEESVFVDKLQSDYIAAKQKRAELVRGLELAETAKVYKKAKKEPVEADDGY